jgi:hypothetical protein
VLTLIVLLLAAHFALPMLRPTGKVKYKTVGALWNDIQKELDNNAKDGWELMSIVSIQRNGSTEVGLVLWKTAE